jgi:TATA-binding protein-associated factor
MSSWVHLDDVGSLGIMSLVNESNVAFPNLQQSLLGTPSNLDSGMSDEPDSGSIMFRGASLFLKYLCAEFGDDLFDFVPKLMEQVQIHSIDAIIESSSQVDSGLVQSVIDALQVMSTTILHASQGLREALLQQLGDLKKCLRCNYGALRYMAGRAIAALAKKYSSPTLEFVLRQIIPVFSRHSDNQGNESLRLGVLERRGAVETIHLIVQAMDRDVLPYVVFFVTPLMGAMSDFDEGVRRTATNTFASLIKLMPLEEDIPSPSDFPQDLLQQRSDERKFIGQLLGTAKPEPFDIQVKINAELRTYQQDGINWMMFLNKYQLHGILCDGMDCGNRIHIAPFCTPH